MAPTTKASDVKAGFALAFEQEKVTTNTVRFQEAGPTADNPVVGVLYVKKHAHKAMGEPTTLLVEVKPA